LYENVYFLDLWGQKTAILTGLLLSKN